MKKPYTYLSVLLLPVFLIPFFTGCGNEVLERFEDTRELMDTYVRVVVYSDETIAQEAIDAAYSRMEEIERIATTWDREGEAYWLNETGYLENPSRELIELLELSLEYNEITRGSFDITIQPLLALWQYDAEAETQFWELDEEDQLARISETMLMVGSDRISIGDNSVRLEEGTLITLGGIAKGYAGDEALETLSGMGIKHALVDAGGDIKTLGSLPDGEPWGIALVNPDDTTQLLAAFNVSGMAVTTSGNYERYFNPEKTAHHILNPHTGFSATDCISVTIIADSGARADALATSVFVMGPAEGMALVESLDNVEAMIIDKDSNISQSSGLSEYVSEEKL